MSKNFQEDLQTWQKRSLDGKKISDTLIIHDSSSNDSKALLLNDKSSIIESKIININKNNDSKRKAINTMLEWGYYMPDKTINDYGLRIIQEAIRRVEFKRPVDPGKYLRAVLKNM